MRSVACVVAVACDDSRSAAAVRISTLAGCSRRVRHRTIRVGTSSGAVGVQGGRDRTASAGATRYSISVPAVDRARKAARSVADAAPLLRTTVAVVRGSASTAAEQVGAVAIGVYAPAHQRAINSQSRGEQKRQQQREQTEARHDETGREEKSRDK